MSHGAFRRYFCPRCVVILVFVMSAFFVLVPPSDAANATVCNACKSAMYTAGAGIYYVADIFGLANLTADYVKSTIETSVCVVNPAYCGYVVSTGMVMTILDALKKWPDASQWGKNLVTNICVDQVSGLGLCPASIYYPQGVSSVQLDGIYRDSEGHIFARFQWDDAWIQDGSIEGYRIAIYRENGVPLYPSTSYNRERHDPQACIPMIDACCREGTCYSDVQFEEGMTGTYAAVIFSYDAENDQSYGHYFSFNLSSPSKPSDVSVQVSGNDVTLSWRDPGGNAEIFWLHYRKADGSFQGDIPLRLQPYSDNWYRVFFAGLPDGTYYVKLSAENPFGKSGYTAEIALNIGASSDEYVEFTFDGKTYSFSGDNANAYFNEANGSTWVCANNGVNPPRFQVVFSTPSTGTYTIGQNTRNELNEINLYDLDGKDWIARSFIPGYIGKPDWVIGTITITRYDFLHYIEGSFSGTLFEIGDYYDSYKSISGSFRADMSVMP